MADDPDLHNLMEKGGPKHVPLFGKPLPITWGKRGMGGVFTTDDRPLFCCWRWWWPWHKHGPSG